MKSVLRILTVLTGALFLSSCAAGVSGIMNLTTGEDDVLQKTANYFQAEPEAIEIRDREKGALRTTYSAVHSGKLYNCQIYYGDVTCNFVRDV